MREATTTIRNRTGLHARPATELARVASSFASDVILLYDGRATNAKSPFAVLSADVRPGAEVTVRIEGSDENEALAAVLACLQSLPD
ncbi:HPr family phosphocarrier protein [Olsenella uli]|uniref:HPr family phosphocarrier protein n=1 Tax=Olsenella uli TaxID=133926 RepID=UPI001959B51B|nr:HPr family phosphocarrier protein [Olsenella uli]MBM6676098.1 HPr family phosphocarrier protein [Olsenella uli]